MRFFKNLIMLALAVAAPLAFAPTVVWSAEGASYLSDEGSSPKKRSNRTKTVRSGRGGGLAGKLGDVRFRVMFLAGSVGGCAGLHQRYVKASGHSAYASTPMYNWQSFHCAVGLNSGSQKAAERQALASCEKGKKRYKVGSTGRCEIYMSK